MYPNRPLHLLGQEAQSYTLTEELKAQMMYFDPKTRGTSFPVAKVGVIIIHPATRRFYSTLVSKPAHYYQVMKKEKLGFEQLALPLQRMLEKDPHFEMYTVTMASRNYVEHALIGIGLGRVTTGKGELYGDDSALFKVHCPRFNFSRFVIAPKNTPDAKLVKTANDSINSWLMKLTAPNGRLKVRLRDGLGKNKEPSRLVFGEDATVTLVRLVFEAPREFTKITTKENLDAVQTFLLRATGAAV